MSFRYKPEVDPDGIPQYGLIAEEVAKVFPALVANGDDGKPYTVRYHLLTALLLNELQRQHRTLDSQQAELRAMYSENATLRQQLDEIGDLKARLAALEQAVPAPAAIHRAAAR